MDFFTQRALKGKLYIKMALHGHSMSTWALGSRRALMHSGLQVTWALKGHLGSWRPGHSSHSGTQRALRHSAAQGTWTLGDSGSWALGHLKDAWALRKIGTRVLRHSRHSRHFI